MSAVIEAPRRSSPGQSEQSRLFDDLRRDAADSAPAEGGRESLRRTRGPVHARGEPHPRSGGDRLTLEDHLERTWEGLLAVGAAECPVCGGSLERSGYGGSCRGCGSELI